MIFTLTGSVSTLASLVSVSAGVVTTLLVCGVTSTLETAEVRLLTSPDAMMHVTTKENYRRRDKLVLA